MAGHDFGLTDQEREDGRRERELRRDLEIMDKDRKIAKLEKQLEKAKKK